MQAGDLLAAVSVFKTGVNEGLLRTIVRSSVLVNRPYKGLERRTVETVQPKAKTAPAPKSAATPAAKTRQRVVPAGGDDEWETF
jgi:hypothetical protein